MTNFFLSEGKNPISQISSPLQLRPRGRRDGRLPLFLTGLLLLPVLFAVVLGQLLCCRFVVAMAELGSCSAAARVSASLRRAEEIIYGARLSRANSRRRRPAVGCRPRPPMGRESGSAHLLHQVDEACRQVINLHSHSCT